MSATGRASAGAPIFLAPHYDDVALSCGGTVAALADAGQSPLIVTCFGGAPVEPLTGFARWMHERWGLDAAQVIAERRREEACAAAALGARTHWLDLPDAIYRADRYTSDGQLFGALHPDDADLPRALARAVASLLGDADPATLYVPLGVGNHVDHQIALAAGQLLAQAGHDVWAYEDFPYAGDPAGQDALRERARAVAGGVPDLRVLTPAQLERRVQAILCYRSQLAVIFRHQGDPAAATRRYAETVGGGRAAERFWPLASPSS